MPRVASLFANLLEPREVFLCPVPGFAKYPCTGKGGAGVDADGNPLLHVLSWLEALFFGLGSAACSHLTALIFGIETSRTPPSAGIKGDVFVSAIRIHE